MASKKKPVAKSVQVDTEEVTQVVEKVAKLKKGDAIQSLGQLRGEIQETLAALEGKLGGALASFDEVNAAIAAKEGRLSQLFEVEAELLAIDELRSQREADQAAFDAEIAERDAQRAKDEAEYQYILGRQRRAELDKYNDKLATDRKADAAHRDAQQAEMEEREQALSAREAKVAELEAKVAGFPDEITKAVAKAESVLGNVLKKNFEHEKALAQKDAETARQIAAQEIASLKLQLENAKRLAENLNQSLAEARAEVKEIAAKAVESASGQRALDAIQSFQQSSNQPAKAGR